MPVAVTDAPIQDSSFRVMLLTKLTPRSGVL